MVYAVGVISRFMLQRNSQFKLQLLQKGIGGFGKYLVLFPDNIKSGFQFRVERAEAKFTVTSGIDQLIQCDRITQPLFYKVGCIVDQVIIQYGIQL